MRKDLPSIRNSNWKSWRRRSWPKPKASSNWSTTLKKWGMSGSPRAIKVHLFKPNRKQSWSFLKQSRRWAPLRLRQRWIMRSFPERKSTIKHCSSNTTKCRTRKLNWKRITGRRISRATRWIILMSWLRRPKKKNINYKKSMISS